MNYIPLLRRLPLLALTFSTVPLYASGQTLSPSLLRIHSGGPAVGSWAADQGFSTSSTAATSSSISTVLVPFPAPQAVYQTERYGTFTYTISKLSPGTIYPVDLHFAELHWTQAAQRQFNVFINGSAVLTNFDIFQEAGGQNIAIVRSFPVAADSKGTIAIQFTAGNADVPKISGIDIHMPTQPSPVLASGGVFTVLSASSGMDLDDNNTTIAGTPVTQWSPQTGNTNQQWQFNRLPNGDYTLLSLSNGMALDTAGGPVAGASVAQSFPSSTNAGQQWQVSALPDGSYQITNVATGLVLDSGAGGQGNPVVQSAATGVSSQHWRISSVQIGAVTPYTTYEAEAGALGGGATVVSLSAPPKNMFATAQLEASGHAYVHLAANSQSVTWTNTTGKPMTAINLRYSIPDAAAGGGIISTLNLYVNGQLRQALNVNSKQTWEYESASSYDGPSKDPSTGTPHHFWDETHAFVTGAAIAPGDTVTLQKDSANSASYYDIDLIELETPPAPLPRPANSLSIVSYGAVANSIAVDSTTAIKACIADAESKGMSVWIPQGTFYVNTDANIAPNGITMEGAGMWYSTLYFNPPTPYSGHGNVINPTSSILRNFALDASATSASQDAYGLNVKGSNWLVDGMWLEHVGPGIWADGSNGTVQNTRLDTLYADGINLNNGNGAPGNDSGNNLTAFNNHIRGSGDDGIAINDAMAAPDMKNTVVMQNTIVAPWWANNIGIYGGVGDFVVNNLITDSVKENGIGTGTFGAQGGSLRTAWIQGNIVERGGSFGNSFQHPAIELGGSGTPSLVDNVILRGNTIINPMFGGILINSVENTVVDNNTVDAPLLDGVTVGSSAQGNASLVGNTVLNVPTGRSAYVENDPSFTVSGHDNTSGPE
jgi:hypothetical protein